MAIDRNVTDYGFLNRTSIPLWKWILLHFVKTIISVDIDANVSTVCYAKKLFGVMYIWKTKTYNVNNGKLKLKDSQGEINGYQDLS